MLSKFRYPINLIKSRLPYPLHLDILSALSFLFGGVNSKIKYDNFRLPHYAFGVYEAAKRAKDLALSEITVIEFGVANGRGLLAIALYAAKIEKYLGVKIYVLGFDSGEGMPKTQGYKDHPEIYATGDFPMQDKNKLLSILPNNTQLILLDLITSDWTGFLKAPVGFLSIDVDYYSSTVSILKYLTELKPGSLLPNTLIYFDDTQLTNHNPYQGELLAINEFNETNKFRKIVDFSRLLRTTRVLKNARWINHIYQLHVLDHEIRNKEYRTPNDSPQILSNKYLK